MFKRFVCLALVCMLCMSGLAAYGEASGNEEAMMLAGLDETQYRTWDSNDFFVYMTEATGISFDLNQYTSAAGWASAKANYAAGEDMPDVLFKADITYAEGQDMLDRGVLVDLAPYLEKCCPNLWAILQKNPDYLDKITLPDGRIPTLPYINDIPTQNMMWINTAFLAEVGMDAPTTADELVKVLEAFRDKDPNKNGKKDEVPLAFLGAFDLKFLAHAFGLYSNDYNVFVYGDQVRFMPLEEDFRLFITWCRDLYQAGLLDEDGFSTSDTMRRVTEEEETKKYGILITPSVGNLLPASWATEYEVLMPLSYNGTQVYRSLLDEVTTGAFAVTTACTDIEKALAWVDYLYTEEGGALLTMGKENVDYIVDGDGTWRLSDSASSDTYFTSTTLITSASAAPGIAVNDLQSRYNDSSLKGVMDQLRTFSELCVEPFPHFALTQAQQETILPLQYKIGYYVDMQIARWVLGEVEISDESFAEFENTLYELGLNDFMAFWQELLNNL